MNIGIIGLPQSGKSILFELLTGVTGAGQKTETNIGVVHVPDGRLNKLCELFPGKKNIPAEIKIIDIGGVKQKTKDVLDAAALKDTDAFLEVLRKFGDPTVAHPLGKISPAADAKNLEMSMIITDLELATSCVERINKEVSKGRKERERELEVLILCRSFLEKEKPLREIVLDTDQEKLIRGYKFLSIKPKMLLVNVGEDEITSPLPAELINYARQRQLLITKSCVKIEFEISKLTAAEQKDFFEDAKISEPAREAVIKNCFKTLKQINFFTIGKNEIKAWTVQEGMTALEAAGKIHTDIQRGFIKAEVINFKEFIEFNSRHTARAAGNLRLEGRKYKIIDGDIVEFKFNI
ncbi:MAG: DUF933 domain-containing protein [Candidatus Omnitrophota bacterium]